MRDDTSADEDEDGDMEKRKRVGRVAWWDRRDDQIGERCTASDGGK
jgi:hypothetical protein